jgi:hypothetical protein
MPRPTRRTGSHTDTLAWTRARRLHGRRMFLRRGGWSVQSGGPLTHGGRTARVDQHVHEPAAIVHRRPEHRAGRQVQFVVPVHWADVSKAKGGGQGDSTTAPAMATTALPRFDMGLPLRSGDERREMLGPPQRPCRRAVGPPAAPALRAARADPAGLSLDRVVGVHRDGPMRGRRAQVRSTCR